jgi:PAS domain S-box-containing protein
MIRSEEIVLNVDDTDAVRYAKTRTLRHGGFRVEEASNGTEALEKVEAVQPTLVLLDVNLPDISGIEVCQRIKDRHPDILVLQTSALFVTAGHRIEGLDAGADAYLTQPVEPAELIATVKALLRIRRAEELLRKNEARTRLAQEAGGVGTWEWDIDTGVAVWSDLNYRLMGRPLGEPVTRESFLDAVHPEDRAGVTARIEEAIAGRSTYDAEFRVPHPDGSTRWIHARAEIFGAAAGRRGRMVGVNMDVTQRMLSDMRQRVLVQELHHRVKNTLAIVQSIARQTFRTAGEDSETFDAFEMRLANLARTHDLLMREDMIGGTLQAIVGEAIAPYGGAQAGRFHVSGPHVAIEPRAAVAISMALHELGTNAAKYGALRAESGRVTIDWRYADDGKLVLTWRESGGPPVSAPSRHGFGSRLIERVLSHELGGSARLDYAEGGLACVVEMAATHRGA